LVLRSVRIFFHHPLLFLVGLFSPHNSTIRGASTPRPSANSVAHPSALSFVHLFAQCCVFSFLIPKSSHHLARIVYGLFPFFPKLLCLKHFAYYHVATIFSPDCPPAPSGTFIALANFLPSISTAVFYSPPRIHIRLLSPTTPERWLTPPFPIRFSHMFCPPSSAPPPIFHLPSKP